MARILVVDDEFAVRYALRSVLVDAGHEVVEACDGEEALTALANTPLDIVILDMIMPKKEGVETTTEIRRDYPNVRVIAISGGGLELNFNFLELAQSLGAENILRKPFTNDQLLEAVAGKSEN